MTHPEQKVSQYLAEAHASEMALTRVLQAQIMMTPHGAYRSALETHLEETQTHARRLQARMSELGHGGGPLQFAVGLIEDTIGQVLALGKTPLDLIRGSGGEEKVLKNAKDACATEALEVATYTALEQLARSVDDEQTARLAASIRGDEERMLARILREIPRLTRAVVDAEVNGRASYDVTETGAADALREVGSSAREKAGQAGKQARRSARSARKVPGVARAEGQVKGALASESDLAISGYDGLNASDIVEKLPELSQVELAKVEVYERKHDGRATVLGRIATLQGAEPWPGYDELTAEEVRKVLREADDSVSASVRSYERSHKNRAGVIEAAERERATA